MAMATWTLLQNRTSQQFFEIRDPYRTAWVAVSGRSHWPTFGRSVALDEVVLCLRATGLEVVCKRQWSFFYPYGLPVVKFPHRPQVGDAGSSPAGKILTNPPPPYPRYTIMSHESETYQLGYDEAVEKYQIEIERLREELRLVTLCETIEGARTIARIALS